MSAASSVSGPVLGTKEVDAEAKTGTETPASKTGAGSTDQVDLRLGKSDGCVYAVGGSLASYEPIAKYEGKHRYDPNIEWTAPEEKRLIRRVRSTQCFQ